MFNLSQREILVLLIEALTHAISWGLMTYYVRKGLNKKNFGETRAGVLKSHLAGEANQQSYYLDSYYGSIAAFFLVVVRTLARKFLLKQI